MKYRIFASIFAALAAVHGEALAVASTEQDCLGLIAVLPTFYSAKMTIFYELNPNASGRDLAKEIQSLADSGDKDMQFTYGQLLLNGYCVPQDVCAAKQYLEKSRGNPNNWEQVYPIPPWPKDADSTCRP